MTSTTDTAFETGKVYTDGRYHSFLVTRIARGVRSRYSVRKRRCTTTDYVTFVKGYAALGGVFRPYARRTIRRKINVFLNGDGYGTEYATTDALGSSIKADNVQPLTATPNAGGRS
jgi:hypothetical protein